MQNRYHHFIFLIILFLTCSCNSVCRFGISQKYILGKNEKVQKLDQLLVDKYEQLFNKDSLNVPLNKLVSAKNYRIYIGVLLSSQSSDLFSAYQSDTLIHILDQQVQGSTISFLSEISGAYYYSYLYSSQKDHLSYLLSFEGDSALVFDKYHQEFLKTKVSNEK